VRIIVPYARIEPETSRALAQFAPTAELVGPLDTGTGYHMVLREAWRQGESFLVIEHDVAIHNGVVPQLEACPEPWCLFPYSGGHEMLVGGLGCTRFSGELTRRFPDLVDSLPSNEWWQLDSLIDGALIERGVAMHVHEPAVAHYHKWRSSPFHQSGCPCPTCEWVAGARP
jgi:hypothetical protein